MAIIRALLDATPAQFPFLARTTEKAVLVPQLDGQPSKVIPSWIQNYWAMPGDRNAAIVSQVGAIPTLPSEIVAKLATEKVRSFPVHSSGARSVLLVGETFWTTLSESGWEQHEVPATLSPSIFTLKGITYLHNAFSELQVYNDTVAVFTELATVELTGIEVTTFCAMCSAVSYLIGTDGRTIYWSSPLDPTQWTPDQVGDGAGAGSSKALAVVDEIRFLRGAVDGFYVFTTTNIVYARYTDNPEVPWIFAEVPNSSGVVYPHHIAEDTNTGTLFLWTSNGMAVLGGGQLQYIMPEATEFLAGSTWEVYNPINKKVDAATYNNTLDLSLAFSGGRFLCLLVGTGVLASRVLMFDTLIKKWSRLEIDCACVTINMATPDPGFTFEEWEQTFWQTPESFASMGGDATTTLTDALTLTYVRSDGEIPVLTPVDIYTEPSAELGTEGYTITVLENVLLTNCLAMTRGTEIELTEVSVFMVHHNYPSTDEVPVANTAYRLPNDADPGTNIYAYSDADPTLRTYLEALSNGNEKVYTERTIGRRISLVLENFSTLQGVEFGIVQSGKRR